MTDRIIIAGAAGRDFHDFNSFFRDNRDYEVVAFTAAQIPNIDDRRYPKALSGDLYPEGIPIYPESQLSELILTENVDQVVFSYSDVAHETVMHLASRVLATGADFRMLGTKHTMLKSSKQVVSVCAVRTGSGKSQTSRYVVKTLQQLGYRNVAAVRHPMPYGNLEEQAVQRFATYEDLDRYKCTIEEREEYEPYLEMGATISAGVDYGAILEQVEQEADIIVWDGGNNDLPFYRPDYHIVVTDPHRAGHELRYHPGEANLRLADLVIINKVDTADRAKIDLLRENIGQVNQKALVIETASPISVERPELIKGRKVLVVEDGPSITHGEMAFGAGSVAARSYGAAELVDTRPYAVGSIAEIYKKYPHIGPVLPAMGYGENQIRELEETINQTPADLVLIATPIDLARVIDIELPVMRVSYRLQEMGEPSLLMLLGERFQ